jgi:hypothetical protein
VPRPEIKPPYEFCSVGSIGRRDWSLLEDVAYNHSSAVASKLQFHLLGRGEIPSILSERNGTVDWKPVVRQTDVDSYYDFESSLAKTCHVLMALVSKAANPDYFEAQKVTAAMVHSAAYKIPVIVHHELYPTYKEYLPKEVETHSDDASSFTAAVLRMIARLDDAYEKAKRVRSGSSV